MYSTRVAVYRQPGTEPLQHTDPSPSALPQPILRLTAMASIGVGAGLFSASAPTGVLVLTFAPAAIAMVVIAVQSIFTIPEPTPVDSEDDNIANGRKT